MAQLDKSGAKSASSPNKPKITFGDALGALEESIRKAIAYRAYEVYEARGRGPGNDMQDWFAAEGELIKANDVRIDDSGAQLSLRARVPGFSAADIQLGLSPRRLIIWGQAAGPPQSGSASGRRQMLSEIDLPMPVDPAKASATVSEDVLQLQAAKAEHNAA
ncbi:MAG: DUF2934 domain-containing protein [Terriglobia bacterium]